MLRASPYDREIAALAIPALATLIAEPLYVLADTAVVGRLGTEELAGLAVASSVLLLINAVFVFLAYGDGGTATGEGTDITEADFDELPLDQLVVRLVEDELAALGSTGGGGGTGAAAGACGRAPQGPAMPPIAIPIPAPMPMPIA